MEPKRAIEFPIGNDGIGPHGLEIIQRRDGASGIEAQEVTNIFLGQAAHLIKRISIADFRHPRHPLWPLLGPGSNLAQLHPQLAHRVDGLPCIGR